VGYIFCKYRFGACGLEFSQTAYAKSQSRCSRAVGNWAWDTRAFPATIYKNQTVVGQDGQQTIRGTWTCIDPAKGQIVVSWNTGYTDTLTLAKDGNSLTGANDSGSRLVVVRRNSSAKKNRCSQVIGDWAWDTRAFPATIYKDGKVVANDNTQEIRAKWTCINPTKGQIVVRWNTGFTDTLTLSSDNNRLTGANDKGGSLVIRRR
jgi:hypothetical protein